MSDTAVKSPYVNELNGHKIIFMKMEQQDILSVQDGYSQRCEHCEMFQEEDCSHLMGDNDKFMCENDLEGVWKFADEVIPSKDHSTEPAAETPAKPPEPAPGRKFDSGKPMYALLPTNALEEVVKVLTVGAVRYNEPIGQENWRAVPDADFRYYNATQRHIMAERKGERLDLDKGESKGTNCYHLACAITSLLFRLQFQIEEDMKNGTYDENLWKKALNV